MTTFECPICKKTYTNYTEYFECWTNHIEKEINGKPSNTGIIPFEHNKAVQFLKETPHYLERGLIVLETEIGIFRGRIDAIGIDKNKNLVIIDVDNGHDIKRKTKQLQKYRKNLKIMGTKFFRLRLQDIPKIRLLILTPNKSLKEVT